MGVMPVLRRNGFILPFSLSLSGAILFLAVLFLKVANDAAERARLRSLHLRAESALRLNAAALVDHLAETALRQPGASALLHSPLLPDAPLQSVLVQQPAGRSIPLHSHRHPEDKRIPGFESPFGDYRVGAEWIPLGEPDALVRLELAWAAEDSSLTALDKAPPAFWPLPGWGYAPLPELEPFGAFLDAATAETWRGLPWIPGGEELPFQPEMAPALVPVVRNLGLRFSIFAAGPARSREKTVRIRYFMEAELWNPYNRSMRLHAGGGRDPVFRLLFWNLPEVRLHNRSRGLSTGWLSLDAAPNAASGERGLHAWMQLPATLAAGESVALLEPDPARQPEGLARTLHPGFLVGPADIVEIEFHSGNGGVYAACLPMDGADPLDAALDGEGWFRVEGFPADWPSLRFDRADAGPRPFLLSGGSLSFRHSMAQMLLGIETRLPRRDPLLDPRRRRIHSRMTFTSAAGVDQTGYDLLALSALNLRDPPHQAPPGDADPVALFSWPDSPPENPLAASDLPHWEESFRIGAPGAARINAWLDQPGFLRAHSNRNRPVQLTASDGRIVDYAPAFPVNLRSPGAWLNLLDPQPEDPPAAFVRYPAFPHLRNFSSTDFHQWPRSRVHDAAIQLANAASLTPAASVPAFFNQGRLPDAFPLTADSTPRHNLLPLRGWLRKAPFPRPRGPAWLLNVAVRLHQGDLILRKAARLWLLEEPGVDGEAGFRVIRFEWTHSRTHPAEGTVQTRVPAGRRPRAPGIAHRLR